MNAMLHVRKCVLGVTQAELAEVAGVSQATISRWETGELLPSWDQLFRIRAYALSSGIAWNDSLFFDTPALVDGPAGTRAAGSSPEPAAQPGRAA